MSTEMILKIIEWSIIGLIVLILVIYYLVKAIKNKWLSQLTQTINDAIAEAEKKFPSSGSGADKKNYVLDKITAKCSELGIPFTLVYKLVNKLIEDVIANYNVISKGGKKDE